VQGIALLLLIGFVVFSQTRIGKYARIILDSKPSRYVSDRSYSLYLYHLTIIKFVEHIDQEVTPLVGIGCLALSFLCAHLSYRFVEVPFLGLRRRFGSHAKDPTAAKA
jgi:peptidoglycan/LPS O-acetylase OafA/YrhL